MNTIFWEPILSRTNDITYIKVLKSTTESGTYTELVTLDLLDNGNPKCWIGEYIDLDGIVSDYYKYQFLTNAATPVVLYTSSATKFSTYSSLVSYVNQLRLRIKDTNWNQFAFTFWELKTKIEDSIRAYNYQLTWQSLAIKDVTPVLLQSHIDLCYILATDSSKYYRIHAGETDVDKGERAYRYMQIVYTLQMELDSIMNRQGLGLENTISQGEYVARKYPALWDQTGMWQRLVDTALETPPVSTGKPTPTISNVQVPSITSTSALITWETNTNSDTKIEWWVDPSNKLVSDVMDYMSGVLIHTVRLDNLNPSTTYNFRCYSGATVSTVYQFTTE